MSGKATEEEAIGLAAACWCGARDHRHADEFGYWHVPPSATSRTPGRRSIACEQGGGGNAAHVPAGAAGTASCAIQRPDVTIAGMHIPAESKVLVDCRRTSFDPRHFDDPEIFDIGREEKPHLAFSYGPHYCIGVEPARLELKVVFRFDFPALSRAAPGRGAKSAYLRLTGLPRATASTRW